MNTFLRLTCAAAVSCCALPVSAQVLNPTITGDDMLCPNETGTLTTGEFESYQWYVHPYGSNDTTLIAGATSQTFTVDESYVPSYLIVEVTDGGITEMSPEFLVDGWVFAGISVISEGDFETGPNGEAIICEGDSLLLELMLPFNTSITWYNGGDPIAGQTDDTLIVTEAGGYTASAAPEVCPNYINTLGVTIDVIVHDCSAGLDENGLAKANIYPNPATDQLMVENSVKKIEKIEILNTAGQLVSKISVNNLSVIIPVGQLRNGMYFVTIIYDDRSETVPVAIR